ncbi:MAG: hypothetical protein QOJ09_910 [Actinomycetota bacterium]|nr:hypothetical protein [Actinomycetota bacterium]
MPRLRCPRVYSAARMDRIPCADCGCSALVEWTRAGAVITEPGIEGVEYVCRHRACQCHVSPHVGCRLRPPWVCDEPACPRSAAPAPA